MHGRGAPLFRHTSARQDSRAGRQGGQALVCAHGCGCAVMCAHTSKVGLAIALGMSQISPSGGMLWVRWGGMLDTSRPYDTI